MEGLRLLAKTPRRDGASKGLVEHGIDVMDAFESLFGTNDRPSGLAKAWLRFFRLPVDRFSAFHATALAACGLHDLGKATDSFQGAVTAKRQQLIRHEHMSALVLLLPQVTRWLENGLDVDLVLSAVAGHHLKASERKQPGYPTLAEPWPGQGFAGPIELLADHPDLEAVFQATVDRVGLPEPAFELPSIWVFTGNFGQSIPELAERLRNRFGTLRKEFRRNPQHRRLLLAVKSSVIVADSAGSGLSRQGLNIEEWITSAFSPENRLSDRMIGSEVIEKRIRQIEARKRQVDHSFRFRFQDFQEQAARLPPRALMIAPCGAGKTLAAWRWIEAQLARSPRNRVLFLYPTRATATEGFRDYVSHAPETDATLLTGTARYELQDLFENPEDGQAYLTEERLYALGYWHKRVFSATVDQFLGFMQQVYRGVCLLPVLVDSIVVFDEVHSFDVGLFDALKKFLGHFELPVLCMTASLPAPRRRQLETLGLTLFPEKGMAELERLAELPRYRVTRLDTQETEDIARRAVAEGNRVLWVVNTVDRCQRQAKALQDLSPICYHSRFTLDDRKQRHSDIIRAFQANETGGVVAITTQVCEMSLDLDAQVLISEYAPIPSVIQRMGRCNRHAALGSDTVGRVYLYPAENPSPYRDDELARVPEFVAQIADETVSQARLEELLECYTEDGGNEADRWAAFIDDGPWSRGGVEELRDSPDFSVQAVIDVAGYQRLSRAHRPTDGLILPVPKHLAQPDSRLPRHLYRAPADHYHLKLGFMNKAASEGATSA